MDESEPEQMFSRESRKLEAVAKWRMARAELVHEGKGPLPLVGEVNMLFHVIPLDSLDRVPLNSSWRVPEQRKSQIYATARPTTFRYNHDGFLASATVGNESSAYGYTQIFRSGNLGVCRRRLLQLTRQRIRTNDSRSISRTGDGPPL